MENGQALHKEVQNNGGGDADNLIELGEHYYVQRSDGSWRKFFFSQKQSKMGGGVIIYFMACLNDSPLKNP